MIQLESARQGVVTPEMTRVAIRENVTPLRNSAESLDGSGVSE